MKFTTSHLVLCAECIHDCISNVSLHVMLSIACTNIYINMYVNIALTNIIIFTFYYYPAVELDNITYTSMYCNCNIIQCKLHSAVTWLQSSYWFNTWCAGSTNNMSTWPQDNKMLASGKGLFLRPTLWRRLLNVVVAWMQFIILWHTNT